MPDYRAPGVFIEEAPVARAIAAVPRSTCLFLGPVRADPAASRGALPLLDSAGAFAALHGGDAGPASGGSATAHLLAHAVRAYFAEGGERLYVLPVTAADGGAPQLADYARALATAAFPGEVGVLAAPGASAWCSDIGGLHRLLADASEQAGARRFAVLDAPPDATPAQAAALADALDTSRAALYYPWVASAGADGVRRLLPPSGFVCGVYARVERERGLHRAPAERLHTAAGLAYPLDRAQQEVLNPRGVNCIRQFPGRGILVHGARTLSSSPEWKYVSLRRFVDQIELSVAAGLSWVAFEPNGPALWQRVRSAVGDFLYAQWRAGALQGAKPEQAMFVRCDAATMTQQDLEEGRLVCLAGVALVKPGEFTLLRWSWRTA